MQDIVITRRGNNKKEGVVYPDGNCTKLLYNEENFEVITEIMPRGTVGVFFTMPGERFEFYYMLQGRLEIMHQGGTVVVEQGDTYSHHELKQNYMFRVLEDAEILGIYTTPGYEEYQEDI